MKFKIFPSQKNIREKIAERLAANLSKGITFTQLKWTLVMNRLFLKLSARSQGLIFTVLIICGTTYCSWLIYDSIFQNGDKLPVVRQHKSVSIEKTPNNHFADLNEKDLESTIEVFKSYRDSLKKIGGKPWIDFKNEYSGLLDSLGLSEKETITPKNNEDEKFR